MKRILMTLALMPLSGGLVAVEAAPASEASTTSELDRAPTHLVSQPPVSVSEVAPGIVLVDFGRVAFGNVRLSAPAGATNRITVHFGEALQDGRINRRPPGTVRYAVAQPTLARTPLVVRPPADKRNTEQVSPKHPPAVLTPPEWGVVLPFRWVEIEGWPGELTADQIVRQAAFSSIWDDQAASFRCSDETLDRIWELCRYSIKATTFAGVYVDGDRERIPYEADAYLNQLSHFYTDDDVWVARHTFDWLMEYPTWPTEWAAHMIFMAYADWMQTGDTTWLVQRYESLKPKLLMERCREDGLIASTPAQIKKGDIVDWPVGERDGYVFTPINTVVNAFHLRALTLMAKMARALGHDRDAVRFAERERTTRRAFQKTFFDRDRGLYRDGEGTDHSSLHANLFPLAFGLVPSENRESVTLWVAEKGMACSVYVAQYLLEGLFENDAAEVALALMTAPNDRSWRHMVESGTTITWEAWDQKYKPNQDWNHAWGAAPANLLPRFVLGARPLAPGWRQALIQPNPGQLTRAEGRVPTPLGPIRIDWKRDRRFLLSLALPEGMSAHVELPEIKGANGVFGDGEPVPAKRRGNRWVLDRPVSGSIVLEVK